MNVIGEGAYGKVKLALRVSDKKHFAIKKINKYVLKKKNRLVKDGTGNKSEEIWWILIALRSMIN